MRATSREVVRRRVLAVHGGQDAVGAGLERQVQVGHQLGLIAMRRDQVLAHVAGMAGGVADALEAADEGEPGDELGQRPWPAVGAQPVIGVDVLAEQRDLAHAMVGEAAGLGLHLGDGARELRAARVGHDAEGAELVAALLHGQERRHGLGGRAPGRRRELVLLGEAGLDDLAAFRSGAGNEVAQAVIALRPHDEVDDGARRRISAPSAWATQPATAMIVAWPALEPRVLHLADAAEIGIHLLGSLLADVAGVEEDDVGLLHRRGLGEAVGAQQLRHALGIVDVHLAAKRLDEDLFRAGHPFSVFTCARA